MVRVLLRAGHGVVVIDDLFAGHADSFPPACRSSAPTCATLQCGAPLRDHRVDAVFHFASRIQVGESVVNPRLYWRDNLAAGIASSKPCSTRG